MFQKAGSTPSDAPVEAMMICTYCRGKYFWNNKDKNPEIFVQSTKEFNKSPFIHGAISYQVKSLNSHFESESKEATNYYLAFQRTKNVPEMFY